MPIKVNFNVTAVVDPDDGLQPSDLTPETANVRVMILKANRVSSSKQFLAESFIIEHSNKNQFSFQILAIFL